MVEIFGLTARVPKLRSCDPESVPVLVYSVESHAKALEILADIRPATNVRHAAFEHDITLSSKKITFSILS
jgi:hypothetical protein